MNQDNFRIIKQDDPARQSKDTYPYCLFGIFAFSTGRYQEIVQSNLLYRERPIVIILLKVGITYI